MTQAEFVEKTKNAPNLPQASGIEKFWALCKAEYTKRSMLTKYSEVRNGLDKYKPQISSEGWKSHHGQRL